MLVNVLNICSDDELMEPIPPESITDVIGKCSEKELSELKRKEERRITLQKKILAVAKMAKYFHTLREESETGFARLRFTLFMFIFSSPPQGIDAQRNATYRHFGEPVKSVAGARRSQGCQAGHVQHYDVRRCEKPRPRERKNATKAERRVENEFGHRLARSRQNKCVGFERNHPSNH